MANAKGHGRKNDFTDAVVTTRTETVSNTVFNSNTITFFFQDPTMIVLKILACFPLMKSICSNLSEYCISIFYPIYMTKRYISIIHLFNLADGPSLN